MDQSDTGSMGIFPQWTNQTQEAWVYSHDGPIRRYTYGPRQHLKAKCEPQASHTRSINTLIVNVFDYDRN
eukprot:6655567-Pyramimonas_sp.AAC.1